jgi:hypothetical protein
MDFRLLKINILMFMILLVSIIGFQLLSRTTQ